MTLDGGIAPTMILEKTLGNILHSHTNFKMNLSNRNSKFIINLTCSIYSSIYSDVLMKRFPHLIVKYQFIIHAEVIYELIKIHGISIFTQILIVSASHHCIFSFRLLIYIKEITLLNQGVGTFTVLKNKN